MTRLHQHFQTVSAGYSDGQHLVDELSASMEAFNRDTELLEKIQQGDRQALSRAMGVHGQHMAGFGVSLEGVQVHLNSQQVDQIVAFLKKWIAILIKNLRLICRKIIAWVMQKLQALHGRLKDVKEKLANWMDGEVTLRYDEAVNNQAAISLIRGKNLPLLDDQRKGSAGLYGAADEALSLVKDHPDDDSANQEVAVLARFLEEGLLTWLCFGTRPKDYKSRSSYGGQYDTPLDEVNAFVRELPTNTELMVQGLRAIVGKDTVMQRGELVMTKVEAQRLCEDLNKMQMTLNTTARNAQERVGRIESELHALSINLGRKVNPHGRDAYTLAVRTVERCESALTMGLQRRLSVMGAAVDLLDKSLGR